MAIDLKRHWRLFVLIDTIILAVLFGVYFFWYQQSDLVACIDIHFESSCNANPSCYWTEEFEHDGRGPTGVFYCEDKPLYYNE